MSTIINKTNSVPVDDVIIYRVSSPFDSSTHYYKVVLLSEDGVDTHDVSDLNEVYSLISEFYNENN